jgi:hypothetical protein
MEAERGKEREPQGTRIGLMVGGGDAVLDPARLTEKCVFKECIVVVVGWGRVIEQEKECELY